MKKLRLAFLWHMHQPWYRDERNGDFLMPWVFLHAIKDYAELLWIQARYPNIRATYNLVPSLMTQLESYVENGWQNDRFLALLAKESVELSEDERTDLLEKGFFANPRTMISPLWRFNELYQKRTRFHSAKDSIRNFNDDELTDLSVLFLLSWCGNQLRSENALIKSLITKGTGFSQLEKTELLETLVAFCGGILPLYKSMQEQGRIAVFTTPFYHPILPLLLDINAANESDSNIATPNKWSDFSEDAERHVKSAVEWYEKIFEKKPRGFWPAEGSVSVLALNLLAKYGAEFACTDEDVLFKSLPSPRYRIDLYKRYFLQTESGEIGVLFRDKALSDLIGFNYSSSNAQAAADDFMAKLKGIYDSVDFDAIVPVFLDGENAWEFYENNAFDFFNALYERLSAADWLQTVTIPEAYRLKDLPKIELSALQPGSWIYGSFSTWMGHSEKNRAWELLAQTRETAKQNLNDADEKTKAQIVKELMIAEGSDWFWWYGDDHYTPLAGEFDEIFRSHLIQVYRLLGLKPHPALTEPIKRVESATDRVAQSALISPSIDGRKSSYYEWIGAGSLDLSRVFSAMDSSAALFKTLQYGTDGRFYYFSLSGNLEPIKTGGYELAIETQGGFAYSRRLRLSGDILRRPYQNEGIKAAFGANLEIALYAPLTKPSDRLEVAFLLYKQNTLIQRVPLYNTLTLSTPDFDAMWYI
ncbi:MAG: glycoside hydrolase [Helicobacteraceae bacterium]|jgi:alpha-amylase/alpha-mannosidase (GH57 family)|nr:glycoside hydrolase [Helicobacteraceae bacterium]